MKHLAKSVSPARRQRRQARAQTILLLGVFFFLGIAVSAFWFSAGSKTSPKPSSGEVAPAPEMRLSEATRAVLRRVSSPLEIQFYSLIEPSEGPDALAAFAGRVAQLLAAYEQAGGGQVKVRRFTDPANANAAEENGIDSFNRDTGQPCYLGLALTFKGKKETLPRLLPEWEQALESDLTRAISRLVEEGGPVAVLRLPSAVYTNAAQEVKALIPDPNAVSLEEGKRIIQEAALKEFTAATKEMQAQIKQAEQQLGQMPPGASEADKDAAIKNLQQVQREQSRKLKEIAGRARAQAEAFQKLKSAR